MATRRRFTREFKLEAVRLAREQGISVAEAARDLDLHENVLRKWIRAYEEDPAHAFPGPRQQKPDDEEIQALKREVRKLRAERDILKKLRRSSRTDRSEVRVHREASGSMAVALDVRGTRCLAEWVLQLAEPAAEPARQGG